MGFLRQNGLVRLLDYARISTAGQDARLQLGALVSAGVQKRDVFSVVTCGTKAGVDRPAMVKLLTYADEDGADRPAEFLDRQVGGVSRAGSGEPA